MIEHKVYYDGRGQSLEFRIDDKDQAVGILLPSVYNLGVAKRTQTYEVLEGNLYGENMALRLPLQSVTFKLGESIILIAESVVLYRCYYET